MNVEFMGFKPASEKIVQTLYKFRLDENRENLLSDSQMDKFKTG